MSELHVHQEGERLKAVADPELYNGGRTVEGRVLGRGLCPLPRKIEFLPENGGFWCILGLLFTLMQKLVRSMGPPPTPWIRHCYISETVEDK